MQPIPHPSKRLSDLLVAILPSVVNMTGDTIITAPIVESDAEVQPGGVFVARKGLSVDGHDFIPRAIEQGAAAIVGEREITGLPVPYVQVENAQESIGLLAAGYYGFPSRKLVVIGVTGTDGKTTTCSLIHSILQVATGGKAGLISTLSAVIGGQTLDTGLHVTTPSAPQIQALLAQMVANGLTHAVLEMTSHGLAQGRLNGVDVDVAVLTNVTHEHLDYHGTFENYRDAKARLFEGLIQSPQKSEIPKRAVLNGNDSNYQFFRPLIAPHDVELETYSLSHPRFTFHTRGITYLPDRTEFLVPNYFESPDMQGVWKVDSVTFSIHLAGEYNVLNALAAIAATERLVEPKPMQNGGNVIHWSTYDTIAQGLAAVKAIPEAIPGRMERVDEGQDFIAIVDFAHTPNALEKVLRACRTMLQEGKRLIAVFGSAGLRDKEKRRMMAEVSAQLADFTVLTAEDPRTESLDAILQEMAEGCLAQGGVEGQTFIRVPDRGEAIYRACQMAKAGDIVIACGKGHEQSMAFGTTEYPWDDREAMRAALRGTPFKTLPTVQD